ncbi:tryptophanase [Rhodothermus profundi]|uniref:tryptophanase n=1 Tax=Rhodothermus profundi TaxID=633813 RepID=UPI0009335DB5
MQPEPYRIKAIEPLVLTTRAQREAALREAGWNTFLLRSQDVYIDFLTDSGTSAMSSVQWAEMMRAAETLSYSAAYHRFVETIQEVYGFPYVLPTHQGRAAEHVLSQVLIRPGQYVANNMYFTTTREHQERAGGIFVDVIIDEAHDPAAHHPFKGNMDPEKLRDLIRRVGPEQVAYVCLELNVNMAGGQPVSLENVRTVAQLCREFGIPLIFDATRAAENAYFIKAREPGMQDRAIPDIFRELMSYADGITVSAKKDLLVNIGGFLAVRDAALYRRMEQFALRFEGHPADGGLARRDLVAMAQGAREMLDVNYLRSRIEQVAYLAAALRKAGVPIVEPPGGHAVFIDARRFLPHLPQDQFPAQRLAGEIYLAAGVRAMERGIVSAGRDPETGQHKYPRLELVRLTIPRRVYTQRHLDVAAEGILDVFARREQIGGLRMVFEPPVLRFFTARFEPMA